MSNESLIPPAESPAETPANAATTSASQTAADGNPGPGTVPADLEDLKVKAARCDEYYDRLVRTMADLDNYKKRAARERTDAIRFANEALLERLIPALDSFDMALAAANQPQAASVESLRTGIQMVFTQFKGALADAGLEEIDAVNQDFDPKWHEAVAQQESADVPEGRVLLQVRKGYKLKDRLIRPATVVVARKPSN